MKRKNKNITYFYSLHFFCRDDPSSSDLKRYDMASKEWELSFLRSPTEILVKDNKVTGIRLEKNKLITVRTKSDVKTF